MIQRMKNLLGTGNIEQAIQKLMDENVQGRKKIEEIEKQQVLTCCQELEAAAKTINGMQLLSHIGTFSPDMLRNAAFQLRKEPNRIVVLGSVYDNKPNLVVALSDDLAGRFDATKLVRAAGKLIQGGGGGQPALSMAGGKNAAGVPDAVAEIIRLVSE